MESLGLNYDPKTYPHEFLPKDPAFKNIFRHRDDPSQWLESEDDEIAEEFFDEYIDHVTDVAQIPEKRGTPPLPKGHHKILPEKLFEALEQLQDEHNKDSEDDDEPDWLEMLNNQ